MQEFVINVTEIEELQTLQDLEALDKIFTKAQRTVIGGEKVVLVRRHPDGKQDKFDEFTTEGELDEYKKRVYKYLV